MNVARYAQRVTKYWKSSERKRNATETAYSEEHKQRRKLQDEVLGLKARIEALEVAEVKLQKWEARKPFINHYLQAVNDMSRSVFSSACLLRSADIASDIALMRSQLLQLGYDVPKRSYAFGSNNAARSSASAANDRRSKQSHNGKSFSSPSTAGEYNHHRPAVRWLTLVSLCRAEHFVIHPQAQAQAICTRAVRA